MQDREVWSSYLATAVGQLQAYPVTCEAGLDDGELASIEDAVGASLPPELRILLSIALPVGKKWPAWRSNPSEVTTNGRAWLWGAFEFDIEQNSYWLDSWGARPTKANEAVELAREHILRLPALVPIYAHRFMTTGLAGFGNSVLSVWQATDSIVYGNDLADYLDREFRIERPTWATSEQPQLEPWTDLFDLDCVGVFED